MWLGKLFLELNHLLQLFCIKLFSQSETIFTNDEHTILRTFSFIFALFDLFEKYYSIYLNHEYKNLNHKCPCSSSPYNQSRPNRACEFCLVNMLMHLLKMMYHLYFSRYKLFNYKYVHIVKPNVLHLNKDFLFFSFLVCCWKDKLKNYSLKKMIFLNKNKRFFCPVSKWRIKVYYLCERYYIYLFKLL